MSKGAYVGVGGTAKKIKNIYVGVGGVAKKVKKAYIGVNNTAKLWWESRPKYTSIKSASAASGRPILMIHLHDNVFVYRTTFDQSGCVNTSIGAIDLSTGSVISTYITFSASRMAKLDDNAILARWYTTDKEGDVRGCGTSMIYYNGTSWMSTSVDSYIESVTSKYISSSHAHYYGVYLASIENNRVSFMYNTSNDNKNYPNNSIALYRNGSDIIKDDSAMKFYYVPPRATTSYSSMLNNPGGPYSIHPEHNQYVVASLAAGSGSSSSNYGSYLTFANRLTNSGAVDAYRKSGSASLNELYSTGLAWIDPTHTICSSIDRTWPYNNDYGYFAVHDLSGPMSYSDTTGSSYSSSFRCSYGYLPDYTAKLTWPAAHLAIADLGNYNALGIWDNCVGLVQISDYTNSSFDSVFPTSCRKTVSGLNPAAVSCVVQTSTGFVISLHNGYWITVSLS